MEKWEGRNAFIAGANSGIGAGMTKRFLEAGIRVYAMDKDIDNLFEMKNDEYGENLTILQANVLKEEEIERTMNWLSENVNEIHIVIYSVGVIGSNSLIDGEFTEWQNMLNVNLVGLCICIKAITNLMLKQNVQNGQIVIISSSSAIETVFIQEFHFYGAVKSGVAALAQGLQRELKERNSSIKVTTLYPGLVRTKIFQNSLNLGADGPFSKVFVHLSVDDIVGAVDYVLSTESNVSVNHIVITPRGVLKDNTLFNIQQQ
ncbi:dehydrogenase/reductase SDR family member 11-like [Planococcus citri]|uniref:dehydrogenase/reductase SDR family member 11-like n=1 Tax=Planococcus citri TaxID=170843 RepID=UPI0031F7A768